MPTLYEGTARSPIIPQDGIDYQAETDKTASGTFAPENVGIIELTDCLAAVIHASEQMDKFKKALFRKRNREESGLGPMLPADSTLRQALTGSAQEGDPIAQTMVDEMDGLFHGVVGMITETGELAQVLYDYIAEGKVPDLVNVQEEIGDNLWYISRLIKWAKTTWLTEMKRNVAKLRKRHGEGGFDKERDITRDLPEERKLLEGEVTESIPDPHCPDCGADVDENCDGDVHNCPRLGTGQYKEEA
jgi:NTP pyrophosphatase (non-canonical NTP hydrolase)